MNLAQRAVLVGGQCDNLCTVDCGHCKGHHLFEPGTRVVVRGGGHLSGQNGTVIEMKRSLLNGHYCAVQLDHIYVSDPAAWPLCFYAHELAVTTPDVVDECYHCEEPITGTPVLDDGDQVWLPKAQWRTWCCEDCHVASAEKVAAS